jgi:hypothetical protein
MAVSTDCPPSGSTHSDCLAYSTNSIAGAHAMSVWITEPGVYSLMTDPWPPPDCIPSFDLIIQPLNVENYMDCEIPYYVDLALQSSFIDKHRDNCGMQDIYDNTCLGYYDNGQDMIYQVIVPEHGRVVVELDPYSTGFTGIALDSVCPPGSSAQGSCIAMSTNIEASPHGFGVNLEAGGYYLIVDNWPDPSCISEFDLSILYTDSYVCGDANTDGHCAVSDAVYIINYVFAGGDAPEPFRSGDVNCDSKVNISDAVAIINYAFSGGFEPCDPDKDGVLDC